ncbi:MAG: glycosyltransferase family 2 protein [Planctomycetota bacterium]|nr:glycosyltransferase family 2 protein [Planctomycetota bacterium]
MKPLISVVIPVYNREKLVGDAIRSALEQETTFPFEVIVVDDGSTDGTVAAVKSFGDKVKLIAFPANRGGCAARNAGVEAAQGEFIAFLDSDDIMLPGRLQSQAEILLAHADVGLVTGSSNILFSGRPGISENKLTKLGFNPSKEGVVILDSPRLYTARMFFTSPSATTVRKKVLLDGCMFDENLRGAADVEWAFRIASKTKFAVQSRPVSLIRPADGLVKRLADGFLNKATEDFEVMLKVKDLTPEEETAIRIRMKGAAHYAIATSYMVCEGGKLTRRAITRYRHLVSRSIAWKWWFISWVPIRLGRPLAKALARFK